MSGPGAEAPPLSAVERRVADAISSVYRVPDDVLPAMAERVADLFRPTGSGPALGEEARVAVAVAIGRSSGNEWAAADFALDAIAPHVAALLAAARAEGAAQVWSRYARQYEHAHTCPAHRTVGGGYCQSCGKPL